MKFYNELLSQKFPQYNRTSRGIRQKTVDNCPYGWKYDLNSSTPSKILYIIGCSWVSSNILLKVITNNYPDYFMINKAIGGIGNSMIIDTLESDLEFLDVLNQEITFLVSFSEIGRCTKDMRYENPKSYTSTHEYFEQIQLKQYQYTERLLKGRNHFITTSFTPNTFNNKVTMLDFCGDASCPKPAKNVYNYTPTAIQFLKDNKSIFNFNFISDIDSSLIGLDWLMSHEYVDKTGHIGWFDPYEDFMKEVLLGNN